jgi:PAS domain S-box-containing protein
LVGDGTLAFELANVETEDLSSLFLTTLLSITPDAIIAINDEHRITVFNEGAESTFGYCRFEILGKPLELLLPQRFRADHADHICKFATGSKTLRRMAERAEIFALRKDGHEFPAEAAICKITIGEQRIYSVLLRDITERKRQERHTRLLMRELEHRVQNVLARVRSVIERTTHPAQSHGNFREELMARIKSMMDAHELLRRTSWRGVTVGDLIGDQLKPYVTSHNCRL